MIEIVTYPLDDTDYTAENVGQYHCTRVQGVFSADDNLGLEVVPESMKVNLKKGLAWMKLSEFYGVSVLVPNDIEINIDVSDAVLNRITTIVLRHDYGQNKTFVTAINSTLESFPIVTPPVRNTTYYDLILYSIKVNAGDVYVRQENITDERLNENYCGLMRDGVTGIPSQTLYDTYNAMLDELKVAYETAINGTLAGQLQAQITANTTNIGNIETDIDTLVAKDTDLQNQLNTTTNTANTANGNLNIVIQDLLNQGLLNGGIARDISNQDIAVMFNYGTGFYRGSNMVNAPNEDWWFYQVIKHGDDFIKITAFHFYSEDVRVGTKRGSVWSDWKNVLLGSFDGTTLNIEI